MGWYDVRPQGLNDIAWPSLLTLQERDCWREQRLRVVKTFTAYLLGKLNTKAFAGVAIAPATARKANFDNQAILAGQRLVLVPPGPAIAR